MESLLLCALLCTLLMMARLLEPPSSHRLPLQNFSRAPRRSAASGCCDQPRRRVASCREICKRENFLWKEAIPLKEFQHYIIISLKFRPLFVYSRINEELINHRTRTFELHVFIYSFTVFLIQIYFSFQCSVFCVQVYKTPIEKLYTVVYKICCIVYEYILEI
jgi:hypothetical protein